MTIAREITSYDQLIAVCNARVDELQLTRAELDEIANLTTSYSSKILRKKHKKSLGQISYPRLLFALGLRVFLVQDDAATAKTLELRTPRRANFDNSKAREQNAAARAVASGASPGLPAAAKHV